MNADDFEKQLQRQPLRSVPAEWRSETLQATRAPRTTHHAPTTSWWREFLPPFRWHLAGMSAAGLLIALLNIDHSSAPATITATQNTPSAQQLLTALRENRRQLLELIEPPVTEPAPVPRTFVPPRRSQLQ